MQQDRDQASRTITLFLCGDIMTGRGIDQILPYPSNPDLHEAYVKSALRYVDLAEQAHGPIPKPVKPAYIWGDALAALRDVRPDARIVNLETSITSSTDWQPKGINYRMHPRNIGCLTAAGIDCCVLANNHVLDWGDAGLAETLDVLRTAGIMTAGAGRNRTEACLPAILDIAGKGRVLIYSFGDRSSGITRQWAAAEDGPGIDLLPDLSHRTVARIAGSVRRDRHPGDIVVASIHWGENWGYEVPREHRKFAHRLIDESGADIVHGHSSHHPKGIEVYRGRPILYGCGDFLNDYEGVGGYGEFRSDLVLMYVVTINAAAGTLLGLTMIPLHIRNFRLNRPAAEDIHWLQAVMSREAQRFGADVRLTDGDRLALEWEG